MKAKIHPEFHKINVSCACGNAFESFSTSKELKVEVCSACHPFFTGTQRFVDTAGRVERFQARIDQAKAAPEAPKAKGKTATARVTAKPSVAMKSVMAADKTAKTAPAAKPAAEK
ncbi:MAG: 50S ribosomal protein L31 [Candidatus Riflebacteria bacterium]|nr:50S ribosomal protein L31 [Candidatus Riflebacteria bacterium]